MNVNKDKNPLQNLRVASPCPADWKSMEGDDTKRFCSECKLNVYNVSAMTSGEAIDLIQKAEGRLCVRFYRRGDGRVMTKDCPRGLAAVRLKFARTVALTAGLVVSCFGIAIARETAKADEVDTWVDRAVERGRQVRPLKPVLDACFGQEVQGDMMVGGMMAAPLPPGGYSKP